ncbi:SWI/SNF-related matrix-associated actin-dependent regulator of chromatin subfamily A-like protein 1, partial [Dictyocoela roeselum]
NARKSRQWYDYKGASNTEELNFILTKMFMIRRTKNDVLKELPRKFRRHIILSPREKQNIDIKDLSDISRLYKEAAEKKIDAVLEYLAGIIDKDIKFLVFAHHTQMLGAIEAFVADRNIPYIKIDGNVPVSARHRLVTAFQEDSDIRIAILSLTAASTGLTLTEGKIVIFAELYWNPGTLLQAEDRIHRIGQVDCVDIHYLTAKNTFDEYVWPKMVEKLNVLEKLGIGRQELKLASLNFLFIFLFPIFFLITNDDFVTRSDRTLIY